MSDTFIAALSQQIMASVTDQDSLLIVQLAEVDETSDETIRTYSDPVDVASSIFGFAAEKQVVTGNLLDTLRKLREVVKESSSSFPNVCLFPSWTSLSGRNLAKALDLETLEEISEKYPVLRSRFPFYALAIYDAIETMPMGSFLLTVVPPGFLTDNAVSDLRAYIADAHTVRWIAELAGVPFPGFHSQFTACFILIEAGKSDSHLVKMFHVPQLNDGNRQLLLDEAAQLGRRQGGQTANGYVLRKPLPKQERWTVAANHPKWDEYIQDLGSVGATVPLGEVAEIYSGRPFPAGAEKARVVENATLITGRKITPDGNLVIDLENERELVHEGDILLKPNDVILRSIVSLASQATIPAALIPQQTDVPLYAGKGTIVIRLSATHGLDSEWLLYFLQSRQAAEWMASHGGHIIINRSLLTKLPVPIRSEDTTALWEHAAQLIDVFTQWRFRLDDARRRLFQHATVQAGHAELIAATLQASQRETAARATETLEWKIRNLYPYPLAFRWREIETMQSPYEKYRRILEAAETLASYLAIVGLVLAENYRDGDLPGYLQTIAKRLVKSPSSGINFGDWLSILTEIATARRFRSVGPSTPFYEVAALFETKSVEPAFKCLKRWRDDEAHGRGPKSDAQLAAILSEAESTLRTVYQQAEFVTQYPLRFIEDTIYKAREHRIDYSYRDLIGDHPLAPIENASQPTGVTIEKGALYFATSGGSLYLADPWLVRRACPTCGNREVYVFDRLDEKTGKVLIKSLDLGHAMEAEELRSQLRYLGILMS